MRHLVMDLSDAVLGVAPHSLRAVTPEELTQVVPLAGMGRSTFTWPNRSRRWRIAGRYGQRPVEWLLENAPVDDRWCLIHATHMTERETQEMAQRGAICGPLPHYRSQSRGWHLQRRRVSRRRWPLRRWLRFQHPHFGCGRVATVRVLAQRLGLRARNVVARPEGSTGRHLFEQALTGGAAALGARTGLAEGFVAILFHSISPPCVSCTGSGSRPMDVWLRVEVDCVWVGGRKQVEQGRHRDRDAISRRFKTVMKDFCRNDHGERGHAAQPNPGDLERLILSGDWPPGHRLPFEVDLAAQYGCSRMTANKVLTQLARAGLIERRKNPAALLRSLWRRRRCWKSMISKRRSARSTSPMLPASEAQHPESCTRGVVMAGYCAGRAAGRHRFAASGRQSPLLPGAAIDQSSNGAGCSPSVV